MLEVGDVLEVIGGAAKGGIIVRQGKDTSSEKEPILLQTGALVRALRLDDGRLHYELDSGCGPSFGWVSTKFQGKELLAKTGFKSQMQDSISQNGSTECSSATSSPPSCDEVDTDKDFDSESNQSEEQVPPVISGELQRKVSSECQEMLSRYSDRFGVEPNHPQVNASQLKGNVSYSCHGMPVAFGSVRTELEQHLGLQDMGKSAPRIKADLDQNIAIARNCQSGHNDLKSRRRWIFRSLCPNDQVRDDDGELVLLCCQCRLPLGDMVYVQDGKKCHGECMAQLLVQKMREEEEARQREEQSEKIATRMEYDIGWNAAKIPCNSLAAKRLTMQDVPHGMICMVFDEKTRTVRLASTNEPAAAVNLEFLSTSLQVRRTHGQEPVFSLDPVDPSDKFHTMQAKVFVPEWLEGTSVGELLFQSDYHLKQLSMGEYEQPVVGMKSCFDYAEMETFDEEWSAREWFMVRKAEVQMSQHNILTPFVKMGVEAREQLLEGNSLLDAKITRADHPMVKYADAFTKYFDLIAERKSVIFQLRELAKASVLAKFLLEANIELEESWLHMSSEKLSCSVLEVPQLWNNRVLSTIEIDEDARKGFARGSTVHGIYGGVQFGLDKFELFGAPKIAKATAPIRRTVAGLPPVSRSLAATSPYLPPPQSLTLPLAPAQGIPAPFLTIGASRLTPNLPYSATHGMFESGTGRLTEDGEAFVRGFTPFPDGQRHNFGQLTWAESTKEGSYRVVDGFKQMKLDEELLGGATLGTTPATAAAGGAYMQGRETTTLKFQPGMPTLRGVDLRLDQFDLQSVKQLSIEAPSPLEKCTALGEAFWAGLEDDSKVFKPETKTLLKEIFNEKLSDRRIEGHKFTPPDASYSYVCRLRELLKEEEYARRRRTELFLSEDFDADNLDATFPSSWKTSAEISRGRLQIRTSQGQSRQMLHRRNDYEKEVELLDQVLKSSVPVFEKSTEEGMTFRIYRIGSLEFRSTQEVGMKEKVGAVFSIHSSLHACRPGLRRKARPVMNAEKIIKVTEYVEKAVNGAAGAGDATFYHRYYVVLETEKQHKILTELLRNGKVNWIENEDFEPRHSLAKVLRCSEGSKQAGVTVEQVKKAKEEASQDAAKNGISSAACKHYMKKVSRRACNELA